MISDKNISFYAIGFIIALPILVIIATHVLKSMGVDHPLLYALIGTPFLLWLVSVLLSIIDDSSGYLDS